MKNRRILYLCVIFILLTVLLCACSAESPEPASPVSTEPPELLPTVYISELMASNKSTLRDEKGLFPDWLELYNYGSEAAELGGFSLSDGKNSWQLPQCSLGSGEYLLIYCDKEAQGGLYADFSLSSTGETVSLISPRGSVADSLSYTESPEDVSLVRTEDGQLKVSELPSPGYENSHLGYAEYQSSLETASPLLINEVMTYNEWYLPISKEYFDLIELINVSDAPLELSDWFISDSGSDRAAWQLPQYSLAPGEIYVIQCTERADGAPFALNSESEQLFLSYKDGSLSDFVRLRDIKYGGSIGRLSGENGFFYFDTPSPGSANSGGERSISAKPLSLEASGVFNGVDSVTVSLYADGAIYYTTDGSMPDSSDTLYTEPFTLSETAVIRAVSIEEGRLKSESLDLSYIINEGHELPVVSLVAEPDDLFGRPGIYSHPTEDWERCCSVSLYDGESSFTMAGGMKMHGATSRVAQSKKSFKINFRPRYNGALSYDLFENGVTDFSSILLRSAQEDAWSTQMRDIIMHELASQVCPSLPAQDYKYCVLYINGEYWGLYAIREAHSTAHYANHYGYAEESVEHWKEAWPDDSSAAELYRFVLNNDMSLSENYAVVKEKLHIESFIAWNIIQSYSGNLDINSPNVRFYYSPEDDQLRYALVDLDLGMYPLNSGFEKSFYTGYAFSGYSWRLLKNDEYCKQFLTQLSEYLNGPLSDENVEALIRSLADEIRSEIPRDYARWGGIPKVWDNMLEKHLMRFLTVGEGRALRLAHSICNYISVSDEEYEMYFGNLG